MADVIMSRHVAQRHRFCFIDVEECISFPEMPKEKSQRATSARPLSRPERCHDATMLHGRPWFFWGNWPLRSGWRLSPALRLSISALAQRAQQLHTMLRLKREEALGHWVRCGSVLQRLRVFVFFGVWSRCPFQVSLIENRWVPLVYPGSPSILPKRPPMFGVLGLGQGTSVRTVQYLGLECHRGQHDSRRGAAVFAKRPPSAEETCKTTRKKANARLLRAGRGGVVFYLVICSSVAPCVARFFWHILIVGGHRICANLHKWFDRIVCDYKNRAGCKRYMGRTKYLWGGGAPTHIESY